MNPNGRKESCGFEHCCANYHKGTNSNNCIAEFDDVLECWVDTTNPETLSFEELKGYCAWHSYNIKSCNSKEEILREIKRQDEKWTHYK